MQRLALAAIFVAILAGLALAVLRAVSARMAERPESGAVVRRKESGVQKVAFFVLLCLILYVSMTGAS